MDNCGSARNNIGGDNPSVQIAILSHHCFRLASPCCLCVNGYFGFLPFKTSKLLRCLRTSKFACESDPNRDSFVSFAVTLPPAGPPRLAGQLLPQILIISLVTMSDGGGAAASTDEDASNIAIRDFASSKDDFGRWVQRFENAVKLSTKDRDEESLQRRYKNWLPLKLDEEASTFLEQLDVKNTDWPDLKTQLVDLLIDPQERQRWRARQSTITWDGKESIHTLASRVKRAVDLYDKHLPKAVREQEYFSRFRNAFKRNLKRVIDMNCPEERRTINEAKDAVMRFLLASADGDDKQMDDMYSALSSTRSQPTTDGISGVRRSLAIIATEIQNIARSIKSLEDRLDHFETRLCAVEKRHHCDGRPHEIQSHSRRSYTREEREPSESSSNQEADHHPRRSYTRGKDGSSSENSSDQEEEEYQFASEHRNAKHRYLGNPHRDRNLRRK